MSLTPEQIELRRRELVMARAEFDWSEPMSSDGDEVDGPSVADVERALRDENIRALARSDFRHDEIATATGCDAKTVSRILKRGRK